MRERIGEAGEKQHRPHDQPVYRMTEHLEVYDLIHGSLPRNVRLDLLRRAEHGLAHQHQERATDNRHKRDADGVWNADADDIIVHKARSRMGMVRYLTIRHQTIRACQVLYPPPPHALAIERVQYLALGRAR